MKILYISTGGPTQDYLRDSVFHGLRSLLGPDVVDVGRLDSMYQGADRSKMYGKGFTLYGLLPDVEVDRSDIPKKIANHYFDLVFYGSIHRCQDYLYEVAAQYSSDQIIFIDGEDHPGYLSGLPGVTFKRELYNPQPGALPISFGIPKEKILRDPPVKSSLMAPMDPLRKETYIYKTEESYYGQYASACYAATMKKAGWDCLRHYEILSQWCLPYFRVFDQCPALICHDLPRKEMRLIQQSLEIERLAVSTLQSIYSDLIGIFMLILKTRLTTTAIATHILDTVKVSTKETVACS